MTRRIVKNSAEREDVEDVFERWSIPELLSNLNFPDETILISFGAK